MRPYRVVSNVNSGQQTPTAIDLRVVFVHFRDDQEDWSEQEGERKCKDQWVRGEIEGLEAFPASCRIEELDMQLFQLRYKRLHSQSPVCTVCERPDRRQNQIRRRHDK